MENLTEHTLRNLLGDLADPISPAAEEGKNGQKDKETRELADQLGKLDLLLDTCLNPEKNDTESSLFGETGALGSVKKDQIILFERLFNKKPEVTETISPILDATRTVTIEGTTSIIGTTKKEESTIKEGTVIGERYEVKEYLDKGGCGVVFKGYHKKLKKEIAIKFLNKEGIGHEQRRQRFLQEARIMANINHPNVVRVYDAGDIGDYCYLVMDFVKGRNLNDFIKQGKNTDTKYLSNLMIDISDALEAIHEKNIIHRDIKPANIMIDENGKPILMDFGISKVDMDTKDADTPETIKEAVLGTPSYMAPEQFHGSKGITKASDVYSLGATFYHLLTNKLPITGKSTLEIYKKHLDSHPIPAHMVSKKISKSHSMIIEKMLEKDPQKRYPDASKVKEALKQESLSKLAQEEISKPAQENTSEPVQDKPYKPTNVLKILLGICFDWNDGFAWDEIYGQKPPPAKFSLLPYPHLR